MCTIPALRSQAYAALLLAFGAAGAVLVLGGVVPLPDVEGALEEASRTLGSWAYPAVAGFAFLETGAFIGLLVPGETAVVVGGVVAERGEVQLLPLIGLVWMAAAAGDVASFLLGRRLGRPFLEQHGGRVRLGPDRLAQVERFYARHGGKAVLVGRFAGVVRAVSPFLAGTSGLALRRFIPWSVAGALLWAATFTLVGYGFSESFAQSGETAARIGLGAAALAGLALLTGAWLRRRGLWAGRPGDTERGVRAESAEAGAEDRPRDHVEREVNPQVHAGERHRRGDGERHRPQPGAHDREDGGCGERRRAVTGGERRVVRDRDERAEARLRHGRPRAVEGLLQDVHDQRRDSGGRRGGGEGQRQAAAAYVGAEAEAYQKRPLDPPRRDHHEGRGQQMGLESRSGLREPAIEVEHGIHRSDRTEASKVGRLLLAVNGRASGIPDPHRAGDEVVADLQALGAEADVVVTESEEELWDVLRSSAELDRRVVLMGGDGTLHAAANAPLRSLPELALVPAGRANNVARALGIPTERPQALAVAASMPAQPVDALRVATPDRFIYAIEAVSAGFQAEARAAYRADNSADLRQGLRALFRALRRYRPYRARVDLDSGRLRSRAAAQLFLSNLPFFGFGFEVDPGAEHADGRFEAILLEARSRRRLLRLLAAARRGRHLGKRGVQRLPATRARLTEALPLVADAVPLGTTTATVTIEPARLRVASPLAGATT
ncbi:MAG TPA: VTT domain-containing protein [Thermoleophilaceae bacterium]|nr:VTT domain-containing protein [Thermoleophilaceae bacterium]